MTGTRSSSESNEPFDDTKKITMALGELSRAERENIELGRRLEAAEAWIWKDGQPLDTAQCSGRCGALVTAASDYLATFDRCAGSSSAVEAEEFANGRQAMRDALSAMTSTDRNTS